MSGPFLDAYTALQARLKIVDVITNNLANANTAGFKRDFATILQDEAGFDYAGTQADLAPGEIAATGNDLDVAINGPGFFVIDTPGGRRYTRMGSFNVNAAGELVTKDGMKVLSTSDTPIVIGDGKAEIRDGGVVTADGNEIATLKIVTFNDRSKIQKEGNSRFVWTGAPNGIQTVSDPSVKSAYLERSNVNAVDEMVHLMAAFREFEAVQKSLKTLMSEMNDKLIQEFGKLG
jgi:flagellar basal-body rod protein FlgG